MALVAGLEAPNGRVMGHAGAWAAPGEPDARTKLQALQDAGAVIVNHPERFGDGMKSLLAGTSRRPETQVSSNLQKTVFTWTGFRILSCVFTRPAQQPWPNNNEDSIHYGDRRHGVIQCPRNVGVYISNRDKLLIFSRRTTFRSKSLISLESFF